MLSTFVLVALGSSASMPIGGTRDLMGQLAAVGKIRGPRGLVANPKGGTVSMEVGRAVEELKAGKIECRADKSGIVHARLRKKSFAPDGVAENHHRFLEAI